MKEVRQLVEHEMSRDPRRAQRISLADRMEFVKRKIKAKFQTNEYMSEVEYKSSRTIFATSDGGAADTETCYICGQPGHWSRSCPRGKGVARTPVTGPGGVRVRKDGHRGRESRSRAPSPYTSGSNSSHGGGRDARGTRNGAYKERGGKDGSPRERERWRSPTPRSKWPHAKSGSRANEREKRLSDGSCLYCGKFGHWMDACPGRGNSGRGPRRSHRREVSPERKRKGAKRGRSPRRSAGSRSADERRPDEGAVDKRRPRAGSAGKKVAFSKARLSEVGASGADESA